MTNVLIVDDEKSIRISLREFLVADGYEVETAANAEDAMRFLGEHDVDVVVSDIGLPAINGIELLQAIRKTAPFVQVIIMTGDPTGHAAAEVLRSGAIDYITKPVNKSATLRSVGNAAKVKALDDERRHEQEAKERCHQELQVAVTSLTEANEQLRQAAAFREEVEQIARRDLKAPLSTVLAAPDLIRMMGGNLTDKQLSDLKKIEEAGRRLLDMLTRIC